MSVRALALSLLAGGLLALSACDMGSSLKNRRNVAAPLQSLDAAEVDALIAQAVSQAQALGVNVAVAITDREGEILGAFRMTRLQNGPAASSGNVEVAISKAATASAFQSEQNAFSTRSAFFIVQGNFPPSVRNAGAGPLFGVQDSNQTSSDIKPVAFDVLGNARGTGISGEFGGVPLYKNGAPVGGIGVDSADDLELLGLPPAFTLVSPLQNDLDEAIAAVTAASATSTVSGAPRIIDATNAFIDGISVPFVEAPSLPAVAPLAATAADLVGLALGLGEVPAGLEVRLSPLDPEDRIEGQYGVRTSRRFIPRVVAARGDTAFVFPLEDLTELGAVAPPFYDGFRFLEVPVVSTTTSTLGGVPGEIRFAFIDSIDPPTDVDPAIGGLEAADVGAIIARAVARADRAAAGIRLPRGEGVRVHVVVVDARGNLLGAFRMGDGTLFSFDVAVQKARTCAFFSTDGTTDLDHEGLPLLVNANLDLDPTGAPLPMVAFGCRSIGFLAQPFFPPGIQQGPIGPLASLRNLVNRGTIPVEDRPSLSVVFPPPRPPSNGNAAFDDDVLTPGPQIFDDYAGLIPPDPALVLQARQQVAATGGFALFADRTTLREPGLAEADQFVSPGIQAGIQTFPGAVPLYRNGILVGAIGVSGDGVDEDDLTAFAGGELFPPPNDRRVDAVSEADIVTVLVAKLNVLVAAIEAHPDDLIRLVYGPLMRRERDQVKASLTQLGLQGVRVPYVKFPRRPDAR